MQDSAMSYRRPTSLNLRHVDSATSNTRHNELDIRNLNTELQIQHLDDHVNSNEHENHIQKLNEEFATKSVFYNTKLNKFEPTNENPEDAFERLEILGTGSCGSVYKMKHVASNTLCAVKQLIRPFNVNAQSVEDNSSNKRIFIELKTILACNHENIIKCIGYFITECQVWICSELMLNSLSGILLLRDNQPFDEQRMLAPVACSVIKALDYLKREHNTMHRDVRPANILVDNEGLVKICDFSISGILEHSLANTSNLGCWRYIAPERFSDELELVSGYDVRADVWSLGITLAELASGQKPYKDYNEGYQIASAIRGENPANLDICLSPEMGYSKEFKNLLSICLRRDRKTRPDFKYFVNDKFFKMYAFNTQFMRLKS